LERRNLLGIEGQLLSVILWVSTLKLLQLTLFPHLHRTFGSITAPIAYSASILLFTLTSWYCGLAHLPIQLALIPFVILFGWNLVHHTYREHTLRNHLFWDILFFLSFAFILLVRFVNPTISFAEKFMDHAFIASIMRIPVVPPLDPWYAGGSLNIYYYLGYWMMGALGITTGIPSTIVFNLALPTIFALTIVNGYAVGCLLLDRFRWIPLLTFFSVNPSFFLHLLQGEGIYTVMWESTRTITSTINEFPLFSFLWGDVHPHVVGLFNQIFLLTLLIFAYLKWNELTSVNKQILVVLIALSLGSMAPINTWDALVYVPLFILLGICIWYCTGKHRVKGRKILTVAYISLILLIALLLYAPFYLELSTSGIKGIFPVLSSSNPFQFLLVHGIFLAIYYGYVLRDIVQRPYYLICIPPVLYFCGISVAIATVPLIYIVLRRNHSLIEVLAAIGLIIIIFPELFYLKDSFANEYYRMNTVFKLYFTAWIVMGLSAYAMVAQWLGRFESLKAISNKTVVLLSVVIVASLFISPFIFHLDFSQKGGTLDGMEYLFNSNPADATAIEYLRTVEGSPILVEAEGGDYGYFSRISTFTGIPTIIGWPFHEITWREDQGNVMERVADVRTIYENPDKAPLLMKKYNATLLYVGNTEREQYNVSLHQDGFETIYQGDGVDIYRTKDVS